MSGVSEKESHKDILQGRGSAARVRTSVPVSIKTSTQSLLLFAVNLSPTGIYLEVDEPVPIDIFNKGDVVDIDFFLYVDEDFSIFTKAKIVRCEAAGDEIKNLALEFVDISPDASSQIAEYVDSCRFDVATQFAPQEKKKVVDTDEDKQVKDEHLTSLLSTGSLPLYPASTYAEVFQSGNIVNESKDFVDFEHTNTLYERLNWAYQNTPRDEQGLLKSLLSLEEDDQNAKILIKLFMLRFKLLVEERLLVEYLMEASLDDGEHLSLLNYMALVKEEYQKIEEASELRGQDLFALEEWDRYKQLNSLMGHVNLLYKEWNNVFQRFQLVGEVSDGQSPLYKIERLDLKECIEGIQDLIPDADEEQDRFDGGAGGDDVVELWEKVCALTGQDLALREKMLYCLAIRTKVRHEYYSYEDIGMDLHLYREELVNVYRDDARLIRSGIDDLRMIAGEGSSYQRQIDFIIKLLQSLLFQFSKLVKSIPQPQTEKDSLEGVKLSRKRSSIGKRERLERTLAYWRKRLIQVSAVSVVLFAASTSVLGYIENIVSEVSLAVVADIEIQKATKVGKKTLHLLIDANEWFSIKPQQRNERLKAFVRAAHNEGVQYFQVVSNDRIIVATSMIDKSGVVFNTHLSPY